MDTPKNQDDAHLKVISDATHRELYLYANPGDIISGGTLARKIWTANAQGRWEVRLVILEDSQTA